MAFKGRTEFERERRGPTLRGPENLQDQNLEVGIEGDVTKGS